MCATSSTWRTEATRVAFFALLWLHRHRHQQPTLKRVMNSTWNAPQGLKPRHISPALAAQGRGAACMARAWAAVHAADGARGGPRPPGGRPMCPRATKPVGAAWPGRCGCPHETLKLKKVVLECCCLLPMNARTASSSPDSPLLLFSAIDSEQAHYEQTSSASEAPALMGRQAVAAQPTEALPWQDVLLCWDLKWYAAYCLGILKCSCQGLSCVLQITNRS